MNLSKPATPSSLHELLEACHQNSCPICCIGAQSVRKQLKGLFYEYVNDREMRNSLVKSLGFCSEHVRLLLDHKIADTLGASIIYEHLVKVVLREFPKPNPKDKSINELSQKIGSFISASEGLGECLACQRREDTVRYTLRQISNTLDNTELRAALEKSDGFCFPHLSQLLLLISKPADSEFLLTLTRTKLEARQAEMAEVIRKNDHRFHSEPITADEAQAWKKSIVMLAGISLNATGEKYD